MNAAALTALLGRHRLVPVVEITDPASAPDLGRALEAGGLPIVEVTFRTAGAAEAIRRLRDACPDVVVGAGTILRPDQVDAALDAGAAFLVAPGLNPAVVAHAHERGAVMVPGVATATEIEAAASLGLDLVKFFPAEVAGGPRFLRAVAPVYPEIRFMPTGGISLANLPDYLAVPAVLACGGSWVAPRGHIADGAFDEIVRLTREAVDLIAGAGEAGRIG